jgi:hypothetical protein
MRILNGSSARGGRISRLAIDRAQWISSAAKARHILCVKVTLGCHPVWNAPTAWKRQQNETEHRPILSRPQDRGSAAVACHMRASDDRILFFDFEEEEARRDRAFCVLSINDALHLERHVAHIEVTTRRARHRSAIPTAQLDLAFNNDEVCPVRADRGGAPWKGQSRQCGHANAANGCARFHSHPGGVAQIIAWTAGALAGNAVHAPFTGCCFAHAVDAGEGAGAPVWSCLPRANPVSARSRRRNANPLASRTSWPLRDCSRYMSPYSQTALRLA